MSVSESFPQVFYFSFYYLKGKKKKKKNDYFWKHFVSSHL